MHVHLYEVGRVCVCEYTAGGQKWMLTLSLSVLVS